LQSDLTDAEVTTTTNFTSFDSDGFSHGNSGRVNESGKTYVAWNWKANGGTTSSNTDGTITSTVQASTDGGFSIVTYTGTGSLGTVGHGLSSAPNMVIIKSRAGSSVPNWVIGQDQSGFTGQMYFDTGAFGSNSGSFNNTAPTNSVVTINTDNTVNQSSATYVMHCFHNVEGYSKIGSYTGNNSTDGTFVYTGFRPAWVMIKRTNGTGQWFIMDNKRIGYNGANYRLLADANSTEYTGASSNIIDIISNGFKCKTTSSNTNGSSDTYIYLAFAEQPFKFSNAR